MTVIDEPQLTQASMGTIIGFDEESGLATVFCDRIGEAVPEVELCSPALGGAGDGITVSPENGWRCMVLWDSDDHANPKIVGFVQPPFGEGGAKVGKGGMALRSRGGGFVGVERDGTVKLSAKDTAALTILPAKGLMRLFAMQGLTLSTDGGRLVFNGGYLFGDEVDGIGARFYMRVGRSPQMDLKVWAGGPLPDAVHAAVEIGTPGAGVAKYRIVFAQDEVRTTTIVPLNINMTDATVVGTDMTAILGSSDLFVGGEAVIFANKLSLRAGALLDIDAPEIHIGTSGNVRLGGPGAILPLSNPTALRGMLSSHLIGSAKQSHPSPGKAAMAEALLPLARVFVAPF